MKKTNIIALVLGIIAAALLWQFYLKPKYDIKRGDEATLQALHEADLKALNEATAEIDGTVLFKSSDPLPEGDMAEEQSAEGVKDDVLATRNQEDTEFYFESTANRPLDIYEQAAAGDKRKVTGIALESDDIVVQPKIPSKLTEAEIAAGVTDAEDTSDPKSRLTLMPAPVNPIVIKTDAEYTKFKKEHTGPFPIVNFKKDMVIFIESASNLANGFFEVIDARQTDSTIDITYRVNIIGSGERRNVMSYVVVDRSNKKIAVTQKK